MVLSRLDPYRCQSVQHTDPSAAPALLSHFNTCRLESRYTDVEVVVGEEVFPCHRIILDFACPFFQHLYSFHRKGREQQEERGGCETVRRVTLTSLTSQEFKALLDFMYTAELKVTMESVVDVMVCADFLQLWRAQQLCADLLLQNITVDTCLSALVVGQTLNLHDLEEAAFDFILSNLADVMKEEDFLQLSPGLLTSIVKNPCLEVEREVTVVEAVLLWVQGCPEQRRPLMRELLQHARLCAEDLLELRQQQRLALTDADLTPEAGAKRDLLDDALSDELTTQEAGAKRDVMDDSMSDGLTVSSLPSRLTEVLVVVSRKQSYEVHTETETFHTKTVYFYCPSVGKWQKMTTIPFEKQEDFSVAVVNNRLYLTGGRVCTGTSMVQSTGTGWYLSMDIYNDHVRYDPLLNTWSTLQPMKVARFKHGSACTERKLYVMGGQTHAGSHRLTADGEVYDPDTDQWTSLPPVTDIGGVSGPGLAALNGKLYLVGADRHVLLDPSQSPRVPTYYGAQVYDPKTGVWRRLPTYYGAQVYDPKTGVWRRLPTYYGAQVYDPKTGVWRRLPTYYGAQVYDPKTGVWRRLPALEEKLRNRLLRPGNTDLVVADGMLVLMGRVLADKIHLVYNPLSCGQSRLQDEEEEEEGDRTCRDSNFVHFWGQLLTRRYFNRLASGVVEATADAPEEPRHLYYACRPPPPVAVRGHSIPIMPLLYTVSVWLHVPPPSTRPAAPPGSSPTPHPTPSPTNQTHTAAQPPP